MDINLTDVICSYLIENATRNGKGFGKQTEAKWRRRFSAEAPRSWLRPSVAPEEFLWLAYLQLLLLPCLFEMSIECSYGAYCLLIVPF